MDGAIGHLFAPIRGRPNGRGATTDRAATSPVEVAHIKVSGVHLVILNFMVSIQ